MVTRSAGGSRRPSTRLVPSAACGALEPNRPQDDTWACLGAAVELPASLVGGSYELAPRVAPGTWPIPACVRDSSRCRYAQRVRMAWYAAASEEQEKKGQETQGPDVLLRARYLRLAWFERGVRRCRARQSVRLGALFLRPAWFGGSGGRCPARWNVRP